MKYAVILLRYLKGYVFVQASGGFTERFLNLCCACKINLWDVCLRENVLTFCVSRKDFLKLRKISAKSGVKIAILKKTGLVYKYRKYSKRVGLLTGVFLFAAVHLILSMFVWCVDVQGNSALSKSEITAKAESYGLKAGTLKKSFDEIRAARSIAADYEGKITWMSVNIKGSLAVIELREDNRIIAETEDRAPCNIVADFDGVILSAETFYGDCMTEKGTAVRKGDLLINGAIINEDMSTTFYAAKGRITALHEKEITLTENSSDALQSLAVTDEKFTLGFFGFKIPLGITKNDDTSLYLSERKTLNINGYNLPFFIERTLLCSKEKTNTEKKQSALISMEKIQNSVYKKNGNSTVISKEEVIANKNNALTFSGKYTLIDFMGEEKPILSEE